MFSLLITVIAIALVTALALATIYYGGAALKQGQLAARASTVVNQGQQIIAAFDLFETTKGRLPSTLNELVPDYLVALPVTALADPGGSSFEAVPSAYAASISLGSWQLPAPQVATVAILSGVPLELCQEINLKVRGNNGVLLKAYPDATTQCYGLTPDTLNIVVTRDGSSLVAGMGAGSVSLTAPPAAANRTAPEWLAAPSVVAGTPQAPVVAPRTLQVSLAPSFVPPPAQVTVPYTLDLFSQLTISEAFAPTDVAWSLGTGALPPGLTLAATGTVSGTPTAINPAGSNFQVLATYKTITGQQVYSIVVGGATLLATHIAAGQWHTCAIVVGGGVKCWGGNLSGQLGNTTTVGTLTPVDAMELVMGASTPLSGAVSIAAGSRHTCVIVANGVVKCWGYNAAGQLGQGGGRSSAVGEVVEVTGATSLVAGNLHTCAIVANGAVKCWGQNDNGEVGDGIVGGLIRVTPVSAVGLTGVIGLGAGLNHTCAIIAGGAVKCWGANAVTQLGRGLNSESPPQPLPGLVIGLTGVTALAAGSSHTCALGGGTVQCWGGDFNGELGDSDFYQSMNQGFRGYPVQVPGLSGVSRIVAGTTHTCALIGATVSCWGDYDPNYDYPNSGVWPGSMTPVVTVTGLNGASQLTAGHGHVCAITAGGGAKCWGANTNGQLGNGTQVGAPATKPTVPVDVMP